MHPIVWVLIIILAYVYISYYYRFPADVKILSAYEKSFNTSLMLDKQPIVILEAHSSLHEFKELTLPYLLSKNLYFQQSIWNRNRTKYLLIKAETETEIHLLPATKKLIVSNPADDETLITLQIKPTQIVILPFKWYYYCDTPIQLLGVNDYLSWAIL